MAYIEAHQSLLTHRKTLRLVRLLGIDKYGVGGRLVALWHWAIDNAPDGDLGADCADILAEVMGWDGDPEQLVGALKQVGYLDATRDGSYRLHDWWDYAGRLIEKRKSDAERKRAARAGSGQTHDVRRTSGGHPADGAGNVPYRTVTYPTVPEDTDDSESDGNSIIVADADASDDDDSAPHAPEDVSSSEPDTTPEKPAAPSAPVKIAADAPAMRLAVQLREAVLAHNSIALDARKAMTGQGIQAWARKIEALISDPRRAPPDVEAVIAYATNDVRFWQAIVLNPDKLKKHFDTINGQRLNARNGQNGGNGNGRHAENGRHASPHTLGGGATPARFTPEYYARAAGTAGANGAGAAVKRNGG